LPHIFGKVISQAGAFQTSLTDHPSITKFLIDKLPTQSLKLWMDCGTMDWLLPENREMFKLLAERGYDVTYKEHGVGHNYTAWRDLLPEALSVVFPPK
jgi:enterochelin esterase-like enzyme